MPASLLQASFTGGELSPALYARTDLARYATALRTCRNFIVRSTGGVENRAGLQFVGAAKTGKVRIIPFQFSASQAYVIELGDEYLRIYRDGSRVGTVELETPWSVDDLDGVAFTQSADVMTLVHPDYRPRQLRREAETSWVLVEYKFTDGPFKEINTNAAATIYASSFEGAVTLISNTDIFEPTHVGALLRMEEEDLSGIRPWQSDRTIAIRGANPYGQMRRSDGKVYRCVTDQVSGGVDETDSYEIRTGTVRPVHETGVEADGDGEPLRSGPTRIASRAGVDWEYLHSQFGIVKIASYKSPNEVTANVLLRLPDSCVGGPLNSLGPVSFTGNGVNARYYFDGADSQGTFDYSAVIDDVAQAPSDYSLTQRYSGYRVTITLPTAPINDAIVRVRVNGVEQYAEIADGSKTVFAFEGGDSGTAGDYKVSVDNELKTATVALESLPPGRAVTFATPPGDGADIQIEQLSENRVTSFWAFGAWSDESGWPSVVTYYSDRLTFARTKKQPQTTWMSQVSDYEKFGVSTPVEDSDAIQFTINARQINDIRDIIPLSDMVLLTAGGEWRMTTTNGTVAPNQISLRPQSYRGAKALRAEIIGNSALYVQAQGSAIRDLRYSFDVDGYQGQDLTLLAEHLFEGQTITAIAFQQVPYSTLWCVRSDGVLLSMTYLPDQQVYGWAPHDTDGAIESVCVVPAENEDQVYVSVRRKIDGATVRYIERLHTRRFASIADAFFVDSGLTYDGRNTNGNARLTISGSGYTVNDAVTVSASGHAPFAAGDVGDQLWFGDIRLQITAYNSSTSVDAVPLRNVPGELQNTPTSDWGFARDTIAGLGHLEGRTVAVLADGNVQAEKVVDNGAITLDRPGQVVHVGLPYVSDFETLEVNAPGRETLRDKAKLIPRVSLIVRDTRGLIAGPRETSELYEVKQRFDEDYLEPTDLLNGLATIDIESTWNRNGRVFVRQDQPLPATILGVIPEVEIGGR